MRFQPTIKKKKKDPNHGGNKTEIIIANIFFVPLMKNCVHLFMVCLRHLSALRNQDLGDPSSHYWKMFAIHSF